MKGTNLPTRRVLAIDNRADLEHATLTRMTRDGAVFTTPMPWDHLLLTDPAAFVAALTIDFAGDGEGTIVLHRPPLTIFDDSNYPRQLRDFVDALRPLGWTPGAGVELGSGWLTWTNPTSIGAPVVHMCIRAMLPADTHSIIQPTDTMEQIVERLTAYGQLVGAPYRATPGVSGLAALRAIWAQPMVIREPGKASRVQPRRQPRWIWGTTERDKLTGAGDIIWRRNVTPEERRREFVVPFDVRAMYLAAAAGVRLGFNAPEHTGAEPWDPSLSGFFRIYARGMTWADSRHGVPIVNPNRINSDGTTWVTAPILAYLSEQGYGVPDVLDSYICEGQTGTTYLTKWADKLRDALPDAATAGDRLLRRSIKMTYVESVGMMGRPGGRVDRYDWHAAIIDEARTRFHRKVKAAHVALGCWPVEIKTDCAWYALDTMDEARVLGDVLGVGGRIGQFRQEEPVPMLEYVNTHKRRTAARRAKAKV